MSAKSNSEITNKAPPASKRSAGRPREPGSDEAILSATRKCIARHGYSRMTLEAVASEAGVTRPTIYRRWPTKADLAVAAVRDLVVADSTSTGDTEADLIAIMRSVRRGWVDEGMVALLGSMFLEDHNNPVFVEVLRERAIQVRRLQIQDVLIAGQRSGELREDLDVSIVVDLLLGSFLSRYMAGMSVPSDWPERVVTTVMNAARRPYRKGAAAKAKLVSG